MSSSVVTGPSTPDRQTRKRKQAKQASPSAANEEEGQGPTTSAVGGGEGHTANAEKPKEKDSGLHSFIVRTISTLIMIAAFLIITYIGQTPSIVLVLILKIAMFREVLRIGTHWRRERQIPGFRFLPYYFLAVTVVYLYLRTLRRPLIKTWPFLEDYYRHFSFVCFFLYVIGFMSFVMSLRAGYYTYQFGQFAWTHMALFYIVGQGTCFIYNMVEGMIWFLLPATLIICNDIWAYLCGKYFGRHRLIELSPKKTWEGFIGAVLFTFIWGLYFSWQLSWWHRMICQKDSFWQVATCEASSVFLPRSYRLPRFAVDSLAGLGFHYETIVLLPIQLHSLAFSAFASIVAPFGGFFASGVKRAFKIKDFGDLIPGHGGVTDRMDCQLLMATFTMLYLRNFIRPQGGFCSNFSLLSHCARRLPLKDQIRLYNELAHRLVQAGVHIISNGTAAMPVP